jgi:hypothetical protein
MKYRETKGSYTAMHISLSMASTVLFALYLSSVSSFSTNIPMLIPLHQSSTVLHSSRSKPEDIYAAVHRKEHEMKQFNQQHAALSDPIRMAMGYAQDGVERKRLGAALRRVYDDPFNVANPNAKEKSREQLEKEEKLLENGMAEATMRRGAFIVDIKRKSMSYPGEQFARFDDSGMVAETMVRLGADVVFVNVDFHSYGGDLSELKSAVRAVRGVNDNAAVVMKDIVVDEIQLVSQFFVLYTMVLYMFI